MPALATIVRSPTLDDKLAREAPPGPLLPSDVSAFTAANSGITERSEHRKRDAFYPERKSGLRKFTSQFSQPAPF